MLDLVVRTSTEWATIIKASLAALDHMIPMPLLINKRLKRRRRNLRIFSVNLKVILMSVALIAMQIVMTLMFKEREPNLIRNKRRKRSRKRRRPRMRRNLKLNLWEVLVKHQKLLES
jgi:hypothetical protein